MTVIGLMGLPDAGKTTVAENLEDRVNYNFYVLTMKEVSFKEYNKTCKNGLNIFPKDMRRKIYDKKT